MPYGYKQSRISRTPYLPNRGGRCNRSQKFRPLTTKLPKESLDPQIEKWSTGNQWSWGHFKILFDTRKNFVMIQPISARISKKVARPWSSALRVGVKMLHNNIQS